MYIPYVKKYISTDPSRSISLLLPLSEQTEGVGYIKVQRVSSSAIELYEVEESHNERKSP